MFILFTHENLNLRLSKVIHSINGNKNHCYRNKSRGGNKREVYLSRASFTSLSASLFCSRGTVIKVMSSI